jgi:putative addiction module component (TIGR02574 family)
LATKLLDLPLEARLKLVEDPWDSIVAEEHKLPLTALQRRLLDERLDQYELDADPGDPADLVVARIRQTL